MGFSVFNHFDIGAHLVSGRRPTDESVDPIKPRCASRAQLITSPVFVSAPSSPRSVNAEDIYFR